MKKSFHFFGLLFMAWLIGCQKEDDPSVNSIELDNTSLSMTINSTHQFSVTHEPSNLETPVYRWTTSNSNIVTVNDEGLITAISLGEAVITVSILENNSISATCNVTVEPIPVTDIALNVNNIELFVEEEQSLTYTISPDDATNKQVTWSSSDNNIATVDNLGKVKAISVGEAQITVKTNNLITDICSVKVKPINATGISLNKNSLSLEMSDKETLIVSFSPANSTNKKVSWISSHPEIADVSDKGEVTGMTEGNAVITARSEDGNFTAICNITVKLKGLSLSKYSIGLLPNEQEVIHVFYSTNNNAYLNATWSSSNTSIAQVTGDGTETNSALIETIDYGIATITATSADGSKIASCEVNVKDIQDFISLEYIGGGAVIINGFVTADVYSQISNNSTQSIELTSFYMYDGYSGAVVAYSTNPSQLGILSPGQSINLGKKVSSVYYPLCVWTFNWNGNSYQVQHIYRQ